MVRSLWADRGQRRIPAGLRLLPVPGSTAELAAAGRQAAWPWWRPAG